MHETAHTLELRRCVSCEREVTAEMVYCPFCGTPQEGRARSGIGERETAPPDLPPVESQADPLVGTVIADRYRILSLLGRGGMGVVYKAEHVRIGKLLAVKLLHGELSRDRDVIKRFRREADAVSRLSHPNTVQIFDFGRADNLMYLAMEYVSGRDLGWIVQHEGPLPFTRVARIAAQVCASLAEAHAAGLVHRDLKPENVMVVESRSQPDFVKVLDFGLAKLRDQQSGDITRAGALVGTPYYMAPEHIRGEPTDGRADLYAIGALLYKAICGVAPFTAGTPVGVLTKHLTEAVVPPSQRSPRRDVPPQADDIVLKALEKDPARRYQRAEELREDLVAYLALVGEGFDSTQALVRSASLVPRTESIRTTSGSRAVRDIATRGDVDRYEARLRRRSRVGWVLLASAVAGAAYGGVRWWSAREAPLPTEEVEPNNTPADANLLPAGHPMTAYLGKRISPSAGDADVWLLRMPPDFEGKQLHFEVSAIPNMDLAVDVVRAGTEMPVVIADAAEVGRSEGIAAFPVTGPTYYLRVRERRRPGELPTENVSDPYTIAWSLVSPGADDESEINDTLALADEVGVGAVRRGHVGWKDDADVYCVREDAQAVRASVTGVEGLDLVLVRLDRTTAAEDVFDVGGVGHGEQTDVARVWAGRTCFSVRATDARGGARASWEHAYELRVEAVSP